MKLTDEIKSKIDSYFDSVTADEFFELMNDKYHAIDRNDSNFEYGIEKTDFSNDFFSLDEFLSLNYDKHYSPGSEGDSAIAVDNSDPHYTEAA